ELAEGARLPFGVQTTIALRSEGEALFRLGRIADARRVFEEADRVLVEHRFPAIIALPAQIRFLFALSDPDALDKLAERLGAIQWPSIRHVTQGFAAWASATAALVRGGDDAAILAGFDRVERMGERWSAIRRDILIAYANAAVSNGSPADIRTIYTRARRAH